MFTLIKKFIRESVDTPFFSASNQPLTDHIKINYTDCNKLIRQSFELTSDHTTLIVTMVFPTSNAFIDFALDKNPIVTDNFRKMHLYNLRNNIRTETFSMEE